ncbi:MFS transporter [Planococcus sp. N028]|uniref:MFS transporter n=1 Tax=Planococcus shixiaomingii TaxID=3058393 RepID=A0ABT8N5I9_9BACL|nr:MULTISPECIES: MFS transporter [unclassified Planococcus (in: firmicutes)]MDN7243160.1 MFS transporter [Planococcus sp. N028]WKA55104.1 MFS transporter [Planococcus sp. N022]
MLGWLRDWKMKIMSFNKNIKLFMLANVLIQIGMGVFMVMYNLYIKELGMPETVNGQVISMTALASAIILIPAGFLSDRFGRKWIIIGGALLTAATLFYRSFAIAETPLIYAAFFTGLFMAFVQVSGVPFLAENSKSAERVHLFSIYFALMTVANVIGSLLGGIVSDVFQAFLSMAAVEAIRWSLLFGAALFAMGLIPLFRLNHNLPATEKKVEAHIKIDPADMDLKKNLIVIFHFSFASLLIGIGSGLVVPYLNLYFSNRFDASNAYIGLILSLGSAMTAVAMLIGPVLVRKVGKVKALILFQLLSIPFLLLTAFTTSLLLASVGFLFRQALMNAANPIQSAVAMELVHDKYKGLSNSVNQMVFNIGWATMGPVAAGLVITFGSFWGYAYAFTITAGLYIVSSTYYYFIFGKRKLAEEVQAKPVIE